MPVGESAGADPPHSVRSLEFSFFGGLVGGAAPYAENGLLVYAERLVRFSYVVGSVGVFAGEPFAQEAEGKMQTHLVRVTDSSDTRSDWSDSVGVGCLSVGLGAGLFESGATHRACATEPSDSRSDRSASARAERQSADVAAAAASVAATRETAAACEYKGGSMSGVVLMGVRDDTFVWWSQASAAAAAAASLAATRETPPPACHSV